jgi:hypothetical protein
MLGRYDMNVPAENIPQDSNVWDLYEILKREWIESHPHATPEEYQDAIKGICEQLGI